MTGGPPDLSVIVFAFDEAESLEPVLRELVEYLRVAPFESEVVFVDDGSKDATLEIAARVLDDAILVRHARNLGIGAALKSGALACTGRYLSFMPADGQIPPETLGRLFAERDGTDVVFSVYDDRRDDGAHRKLLSFSVRSLIALIHGVRMRSDGPYLIRRALFDPTQLESDSFFLNFEVPIRATAARLRTRSVPSDCRPRARGHSKSANLRTMFRVARDLLTLRFR